MNTKTLANFFFIEFTFLSKIYLLSLFWVNLLFWGLFWVILHCWVLFVKLVEVIYWVKCPFLFYFFKFIAFLVLFVLFTFLITFLASVFFLVLFYVLLLFLVLFGDLWSSGRYMMSTLVIHMVRNHQDGYPYLKLLLFCWKYTET